MPARHGFDRNGLKSGVISGAATGLFSIPEGMAYAQLAGVPPVYGLYSGIVATLVAALSTGSVLMISTLTSGIALTAGSAIDVAGVSPADMPQAMFTITFLVGAIMFILGLARLGNLVYFVSHPVMTGFVMGIGILIIVGQLGHFSTYEPTGSNRVADVIDWFEHIGDWDAASVAVGIATVLLMATLGLAKRTEGMAAVVSLLVMTVIVSILDPDSVGLVGDYFSIPRSLPKPMLPAFGLVPDLALGSVAVTLVALVQGGGTGAAFPNPDKSRTDQSRDFVGQGLGNLAGAFFQSLSTGGSLSRTGVSVAAGATSRWGGVFAAAWLGIFVVLFGGLIEKVPVAVIAGQLFVVGAHLIRIRLHDARIVVQDSIGQTAVMLVTLASTLFVPLQWTVFLGAALSLLIHLYSSFTAVKVFELARNDAGRWEIHDAPEDAPSNDVIVIGYRAAHYFVSVPRFRDLLPNITESSGTAMVWRVRGLEEVHSTFLRMVESYAQEARDRGNVLMLAGVEPGAYDAMKKTGVLDVVGAENVFLAGPGIGEALDEAYEAARAWVVDQS